MRIAVFAIALLLGGCATAQLNRDLNGLLGQNIQAAVARFGYPDGTREIMGDTLYIWSNSNQALLPMNSTALTTGSNGYQMTTVTQMTPVQGTCTIQLAVASDGTIKQFQWFGNQIGCRRYIN